VAQKHFVQQFSVDFDGINAECSPIEAEGHEVNRAVNYEMGAPNALRGRVGNQLQGAGYSFFGIFPHTYSRTQDEYSIVHAAPAGAYPNKTSLTINGVKSIADGATIAKLVAINNGLWVLDSFVAAVTNVSAAYPVTWYTTVNTTTGTVHFVIKGGGTTILDFNCGDGITTIFTINDLLDAINATAELGITYAARGWGMPRAVVNGNQSPVYVANAGYGDIYSIAVNAAHTFYPGDIISFPWTSSTLTGALFGGPVINLPDATHIEYVGSNITMTLTDGAICGYTNQWAGMLAIGPAQSQAAGSPINISIPYWRYINHGDRNIADTFVGPVTTAKSVSSFYAPPTSTCASGNIYIASSYQPNPYNDLYNKLVKSDGKVATRTGLPTPTLTLGTAAGAGLTGAFRYRAYLKRVDAQGNIIEGVPTNTQVVNPVSPGSGIVTMTVAPPTYATATGFAVRSAYKYTAEAPAAGQAFYIDDGTGAPGRQGNLQVGDPVSLLDNVAILGGTLTYTAGAIVVGTLHRTVVTGYDGSTAPSSITVADSSGYTIPDNSLLSAGLTVVLLRTTAGGVQYYILAEVPVTGYAVVTFTDTTTDATLIGLPVFSEAPLGKEHNPPPDCSLVCQHQGGLVTARDPANPNTVSFSTAEGIEYFPLASNNFDVPATVTGPISAIASDSGDRLAIFKNNAYYEAIGDLDSGSFIVNVAHEGDFGIASQASIARINGQLIGLSKLGIIAISQGEVDSQSFRRINARLINQNYRFDLACGVNDYVNRQYVVSIPTSSSRDTQSATLVVDYSRPKPLTFERSYVTKLSPGAGFAMVNDIMYQLSFEGSYGVFRRLYRFNGDSPSGNGDGDSFIDHVSAISYILESQPMTFGEPCLTKNPIRLRVWSIPNDGVVNGWVPFSLTVEGGPTPIEAYIGGSFPRGFTSTLTFSNPATDWFRDLKIPTCKAQFYILRFTTNTVRTSPYISGYEVMFALDYEKEDMIK
jgi:hypothetical protein